MFHDGVSIHGLPPLFNGHFRNRFIGGTFHIFLAYSSGLNDISRKYGQKYGTVPPFQDPGIPIDLLKRYPLVNEEKTMENQHAFLMGKATINQLGHAFSSENPKILKQQQRDICCLCVSQIYRPTPIGPQDPWCCYIYGAPWIPYFTINIPQSCQHIYQHHGSVMGYDSFFVLRSVGIF